MITFIIGLLCGATLGLALLGIFVLALVRAEFGEEELG